ncbi:MAG TPA: acyl-CoA thioesterase [Limnobacter sp.]|uniref:acyl-CoA thioesterase n=1 Tax=Limnobacter sp. TaxID=2003368 RepID=UPI002EDA4B81
MNPTTPMLPVDREPTIRVIPMPKDSNAAGDVFGGWIMSQVDLAGSVPAVAHAKGRVVTVAVNEFIFKEPVFVGDLCSFYADVDKVGRTSMRVRVEVYAQRRLQPDNVAKVTEAYITYVAVDEHRNPRPVEPLK